MTETSKDEIEAVVRGLRPMNGANQMDDGVKLIQALAAERDALQATVKDMREALEDCCDVLTDIDEGRPWTSIDEVVQDARYAIAKDKETNNE